MTLQDFKDQVARESLNPNNLEHYNDFDQMYRTALDGNEAWNTVIETSDRAAELYAKERYDEGYSQGHSEALAGDGL